jgi:hypothetical protein
MVKQDGLTVPCLRKIVYGNGTSSNFIVEVLDVAGYPGKICRMVRCAFFMERSP